MSDTKPKSLGFPKPTPREQHKPAVPRALLNIVKAGGLVPNPPSEAQCKIYGKWKLKALKPHWIGYGILARVGDEYEIDGANAIMLVQGGLSEFIDDGRMAKEKEVIAEYEKLKLDKPISVKHLPEFQQPRPESESTWRS